MYDSLAGHLVRRGVHIVSKCRGMQEMREKLASPPVWVGHHGGHHHHHNDVGPVSGHQPFEHAPQGPEGTQDLFQKFLEKINSPQAMITLVGTVVALLLLDFMIAYAIGTVATNLAIAEDTENEQSGTVKLVQDLDVKEPLLEVQMPTAFAPSQPITASLRRTLRQIRSVAGIKSFFRGLHFSLFFSTIYTIFYAFHAALLVQFVGSGFFGGFLAMAMSRVVTCNLHAAWTHATVAAPSEATKGFFKRFVPQSVANHFVLPTIRQVLALNVVMFVVRKSSRLVHHLTMTRGAGDPIAAFSVALPVVLALAGFFGLILPTYIALVRMELAHMPEDMPAIVPFDRTFGGKFGGKTTGFDNVTLAEEEQPTQCPRGHRARKGYVFRNLSTAGAYMSLDRGVYKRVLKMFVKSSLLHAALYVSAMAILSTELYMFAGKEIEEIAASLRK